MSEMIDKCLSELPPGDWDYRIFSGTVIFACPDHQPRILKDGELKLLEPTPDDGMLSFWLDRKFYLTP